MTSENVRIVKGVETVLTVEPSREDSGNWYWAVKVDGETYADGDAENRMIAQSRCLAAYEEWCGKQ